MTNTNENKKRYKLYDEIINRYSKHINYMANTYYTACGIDVDDVEQELRVRIYANIDRIAQMEHQTGYINMLTRNTIISLIRKYKHTIKVEPYGDDL